MRVVSRAAAGRWVVAVTVAVAVAAAPAAYARRPAGGSALPPDRLVAEALRSAAVPHSGLAESTGTLGLPDLPRLGDVAALLGGTTRIRVWWLSTQRFRVDRITTTGESGVYAVPGGVQTWDFETGRVERVVGASPVRLPRVDDLLPPQAARRLLAGLAHRDRLLRLPSRVVAGRAADGVRVVPAEPASTIGRVDVYVDRGTGLPLSLLVVPRGSSQPALRTAFVDVSLARPGATTVRPRTPPFTPVRTTAVPDLAAAVDRYAPFALPTTLAASPRGRDLVGSGGGTATYGRGLARFVVLPLPPQTGTAALDAARSGGGVPLDVGPDAEAVLVATPLVNAVLARSTSNPRNPMDRGRRWYLLAGTVDAGTLQAAVQALAADPPAYR